MPIQATYGRPFPRTVDWRSLKNPPFLNLSSNPLGCTPSPTTLQQPPRTGFPPFSLETDSSAVPFNHVTSTHSGPPVLYTASSPNLIISNAPVTTVPTSFTNVSTARDGSSTAADVPWPTVVWFPPLSAGKTAAIVAATIVPVVLIIVGALFLLRFFWRREATKSNRLTVAYRTQPAIGGNGWTSDVGYQHMSHTITTRSRRLSVEAPAMDQHINTNSISLRNVPQGVSERHFGDLSFLLDSSEQSDSSDDYGDEDGSSIEDSGYGRGFLASGEPAGRQAGYYIPSSVLDLASIGREFAELNERFGLQT